MHNDINFMNNCPNIPAFLNFRRLQVKDFTSQVILKP